jgi:hypothetical protein
VHYQCLAGHSNSPARLMQSDAEALERAVWEAVRALEQRASLLRRLASKNRPGDLNKSSSSSEVRLSSVSNKLRLSVSCSSGLPPELSPNPAVAVGGEARGSTTPREGVDCDYQFGARLQIVGTNLRVS